MNLTSRRMLQFLTVCTGVCALSASAQIEWASDNFEAEGTGFTNAAINSAARYYKMGVTGLQNEGTNFVWFADAGDASKIVAGVGAYEGPRSITNANAQAQVLQLETEGQTLMRALFVDGVTGTVSFAAAPVYVDTLLKFTPSEDNPEITDGNIKIAVFVNVNSNLVVNHKYTDGTSFFATNSVFTALGPINPADWHRLTIMLAAPEAFGSVNPAFEIYFDGDKLTHANGAVDGSTYTGGSWFFSLKDGDTTLSQVSFQGTGMVDDLVVANYLTPLKTTGLLLTLSFNDTLLDVTFNSAAVTNGEVVTVAPAGGALAINAIDWYQINGVSGTGVAYTGSTGQQVKVSSGTITVDETGRTATIGASQYTGTIATGLPGSYANVPADKLAAWAVNSGLTEEQVIDNASAYLDNYLLNIDESINANISIESIVYDAAEEEATITVVADNAAVDFTDLNGTLVIWTSDDLAAWGEPTQTHLTFTPGVSSVTVVVPAADGTFIKAKVQ